MVDESVQLKTLQTILIIFQSRLHPENEVPIHFRSLYSYYLLASNGHWFQDVLSMLRAQYTYWIPVSNLEYFY